MFLIYGATGYTGKLIATMAVEAGMKPVLGGRSTEKLKPLAEEMQLEYRAFPLEKPDLEGITVLLNCAGPFSRSGKLLAEACIASGTHYLDIAGEVKDIETIRSLDTQAQAAGVMLMPGAGFGIVPTDCMAAYVAGKLPEATHLTIVFETVGGVSQGTLGTVIGDLHTSGFVRQGGELQSAKPNYSKRKFDLGEGEKSAVYNPWRGDLVTAYYSTGIPNIETCAIFPGIVQTLMRANWLHGLWGSGPFQALLKRLFRMAPAGPSEKELAEGHTHILVQASDGQQTVAARLHGPEAYRFTGYTTLAIAQKIEQGKQQPGFQTPAQVYGPDFVLAMDGVRCEDL